MFKLKTFGGLELRDDAGEPVEALAGRTQPLALLAYLAVEGAGEQIAREQLVALFWPDRPKGRARNSLRSTLYQLRRATDPPLVGGAGEARVGVRGETLETDHAAFQQAVATDDHARALELYRGLFLAGVHLEGARPFERWVDRRRRRCRQQAYEAALTLGNSARGAGDLAAAEEAFRQALDLAPLREEPARALLRTLAERGRPADALQLYEAFRERREAELELPPSDELKELVEELRQTPPPASPAAGDRSVAVLPFEAIGTEDPGPIAEGLHSDLLTRLSNVSGLEVISATSVERYRDTDLPLPAIAEGLGVNWVVEGGVQRTDQAIRVHAQLIDPRSDTHAWADSYRRELTPANLFDLQSEITTKIARSLEAELSRAEQQRVEQRPTDDLDAYRMYVQGRQQLARRRFGSLDHVEAAVRSFRRAIERDSTFALAWAGLADAAALAPRLTLDATVPFELDPEVAARRALELGPDLAEAHASMGHVHLLNMEAPAARQELRRAIDLKPSYWEAHHWLGELYLKTGRAEQALDHLRLALELNPQHALARHWLYDAYRATGQLEKSLEEARRQRRMGLEEGSAVEGEVRALMAMGRLEEARQLAEGQIADGGIETIWGGWLRAYLAEILTAQGDTAAARAYLDELRAPDVPPRWLAWAYAGLGRTEEAVETYGRLEREDWGLIGPIYHLRYWKSLPDNEPLREDPRFRELIHEANRAWGLNSDGSFPSGAGTESAE